jgi:hypothetical protein
MAFALRPLKYKLCVNYVYAIFIIYNDLSFSIRKENLFFQNVIFDSFTILSTQKNVMFVNLYY